MLKKNKQSISSGDGSINLLAGRDINILSPGFPTALVDEKINEEVGILRKSLFFNEFDRVNAALTLGRQIVEGELSGGTNAVRSQALAWCARVLSRTDELGKAEEYLKIAKELVACPEIEIADAFVFSQNQDKSMALNKLAGVNSAASRSAAFMIVAYHDGEEEALDWLKKAEIEIEELDTDGKYFLLAYQLKLGRWDESRDSLEKIDDQDFEEAPILLHIAAIILLLSTVPTEFRTVVLNQLPFDAAGFPLASDTISIDARRTAQRHFVDAAVATQQLNCSSSAAAADEYALWLELRDPESSDNGRRRLEAKLHDTTSALRLVPLGIQFGIKLNPAAVQKEIERQIAIHGGITQDTAVARFALAFKQNTPEGVANYIDQHYDELSKYIDKKWMLLFLRIGEYSHVTS